MRLIDADALIKEIKMDIEDVGLQEKMVFYRINEAPQAEPSDGDLISRQDAIDAVGKYKEEHGYAYYDCACDIESDLKQIPSASVEVGEWIPVSERLPEVHPYKDVTGMAWDESDDVLICMNYGNMHVATYEVDSEAMRYWVDKDGLEYTGVTAWMPLPEPYREDGDKE